jgi:membrane protease YdiL (CAAX protease family)
MGSGEASIVLPVSDIDPEGTGDRGGGPPAMPPGPVPEGYVAPDQVRTVPVLTPPRWPVVQPAAPGPEPAGPRGDAPFLDQPGAPPATKSVAWRWLFYALVGFLVGQLVGGAFGVVAGHLAGKSAKQMASITSATVPPEWYVLSTLAGLWVGFFGAPWLASRVKGTRHLWADLGVRFKWIDLWGIAIGVGGQIVIALLYAPFQHDIHDFNGPSQKLTGSAHGGGFVLVALATVLLAPFMEELFFRGLLFRSLARLCTPNGIGVGATRFRGAGIAVAVIVDGLLFGLAHGEWVQLAGLALFGMALATVSYRTGRLGMNMVSHATFNLVAILAILGQRGGVIH